MPAEASELRQVPGEGLELPVGGAAARLPYFQNSTEVNEHGPASPGPLDGPAGSLIIRTDGRARAEEPDSGGRAVGSVRRDGRGIRAQRPFSVGEIAVGGHLFISTGPRGDDVALTSHLETRNGPRRLRPVRFRIR